MAVISGSLNGQDLLGGWKARWGIGRMSYLVPPGLYALGNPDGDSPVLVTANYKMSYDLVRRAMSGRSAWLLVLETYGINVWCAAGKGTFGTGELVRRVEASGLSAVVRHRRLLLPVMGAAGVKAIEVRKRTGFEVLFTTLRIEDLPGFLDAGMQATPAMRELTFSFRERLVLAPIEVAVGMRSLLYLGIPLSLLAGFQPGGLSPSRFAWAMLCYLVAVLGGTLVSPLLLPWLPGRMFALKGALVGLGCSVAMAAVLLARHPGAVLDAAALVLLVTAVSAFYAMNFTGSTPFTSPSGVRREMRRVLPVMASVGLLGVGLLAAGRFMP